MNEHTTITATVSAWMSPSMSLFEPIGEDGLQYWEEMNFTYVGEADVTLRMIGPQALIKYRVSAPLDLELGANTVGEG